MAKARKVQSATIKWSRLYNFDNAFDYGICQKGYGIYCIIRVFGAKETVLYIGQTNYRFSRRLNDHQNKWMYQYRGKMRVLLGTIKSQNLPSQQIIEDVESGLIYQI